MNEKNPRNVESFDTVALDLVSRQENTESLNVVIVSSSQGFGVERILPKNIATNIPLIKGQERVPRFTYKVPKPKKGNVRKLWPCNVSWLVLPFLIVFCSCYIKKVGFLDTRKGFMYTYIQKR